MAGVKDGGGSRIVLRDRSEDQGLHAPGVPTPTPGRKDDVTRGCFLLQLMRLMPMILIAIHERKTPLNASNDPLGHATPGLYYTEREPEIRGRGVREDQGTVTERQPPEHAVEDERLGEHARHTVRSERPMGGCRCPVTLSLLTSISFGDRFGGRDAQDYHHPCWCSKGGRSWVWTSQSRP